jgi:hypothetical protein
MTSAAVLAEIARHPVRSLVWRWNWKSAACSAATRGFVFCSVNLAAGPDAALRALLTEFALRGATAGFYGAITQALSGARPAWAGSLSAIVILPLLAHTAEFLVHRLAGTERLGASIGTSVAFTAVTTLFNSFAMRHGVLTVGEHSRSFGDDLRVLPRTLAEFITAVPRALLRLRRTEVA